MKQYAVAGICAVVVMGCGGSGQYVKEGKIADVIEENQMQDEYIEVRGIGVSPPDMETDTQMKALSYQAAEVDAYRKLLQIVRGVEIEAGLTVEKAMLTSSAVKTRAEGMIRGALPIKTEYTEGGKGCVVTLRLNKSEMIKKLLAAFK